MKNQTTPERAVAFLHRQDLGVLAIEEAAVLLLFFPDEALTSERKKLEDVVRGSSWQWIQESPLLEVFLRLTALYRWNFPVDQGAAAAKVLKRLLNCEKEPGGPYLDDGKAADMATNLVIAAYFSQQGIILPKLLYFIAAGLKSGATPTLLDLRGLADYFLKMINDPTGSSRGKQPGAFSNSAEQALAHSMAAPSQQAQKTTFEECLLAALMISANQQNKRLGSATFDLRAAAEGVYRNAESFTASLNEPLKQQMKTLLLRVKQADTQYEIALLPLYFLKNLQPNPESPKLAARAKAYGAANVFCWVAYTVYDDFLDEEGAPSRLPVANTAMRLSLKLYAENAGRSTVVKQIAGQHYNNMDEANAWELSNCRYDKRDSTITIGKIPHFKGYKVISKRASGHVIGVYMLAHQTGFGSRAMEQLRIGLHHFLVARQLSDDLHDWAQDLERGHVTPVISLLLDGAKIVPGTYDYSGLFVRLQRYFWETGFVKISRLSESHSKKSKEAFLSINNIAKNGPFIDLLDSLKLSTDKSLEVHKEKKDFLKEYKSTQFLTDG